MSGRILTLFKIVVFAGAVFLVGLLLNAGSNINRLVLEGGALLAILLLYYLFVRSWVGLYPTKERLAILGYGFLTGLTLIRQ